MSDEDISKIPGAKAVLVGLANMEFTIVAPNVGRTPISQKHIDEWRNAPPDWKDKFETTLRGHGEFEGLLIDLSEPQDDPGDQEADPAPNAASHIIPQTILVDTLMSAGHTLKRIG